jgi:SAM-dependent methyltransferase
VSEQIKEFYEQFSSRIARDRILPNPRHRRIFSFLSEILAAGPPIESALEVGSGIGITSEWLRKRIPRVCAIDLSEANVRFARSTVKGVDFRCGDFLELAGDEKFQLITLFDVLEHFPKDLHPLVFAKLREHAADESVVVLTLPDPDFLAYVRTEMPHRLQVVEEEVQLDDLLALARDAGFELVGYRRFGVDHTDQYRLFILQVRGRSSAPAMLPGRSPIAKAGRVLASSYRYLRFRGPLREANTTWLGLLGATRQKPTQSQKVDRN